MQKQDDQADVYVSPSPLQNVNVINWIGVTLLLAPLAIIFLGIGSDSLVNDHIVRMHDLKIGSMETIGAGFGLACRTVLTYNVQHFESTIEAITEGPCNPDPNLDTSDVVACSRIGHPEDADIGCRSFAQAVTFTVISSIILLLVVTFYIVLGLYIIAWRRTQRETFGQPK